MSFEEFIEAIEDAITNMTNYTLHIFKQVKNDFLLLRG